MTLQPVSYTHLDVYKRQDVLQAYMCTSVWPGRYAGVAAHDTHVLARIYAGHENLVRYAAACKCAKGVDKGYESDVYKRQRWGTMLLAVS